MTNSRASWGIYISQTDEMLFSPLSTFAVLTFYGDNTSYTPQGLWGQWAAGFTGLAVGPVCGEGHWVAGLADLVGLGVRFRQLC